MGRVENSHLVQYSEDFHSRKDIVEKIQQKFTQFEFFNSCNYPQFDAVVLSNGFNTVIEKRKGLIIGSALEGEKNAPFETLMVTWHGLERADTFWDQVKGKVYPEFPTRRPAPEIDYLEFSQMAFDLLDEKYRNILARNNRDEECNVLTYRKNPRM